MTDSRTYASGHQVLELDGTSAARLLNFSGAVTTGQVEVVCPAAQSQDLQGWLKDSLRGTGRRRSVAVLNLDFAGKVERRYEYQDTAVTGVTFPALAGDSREAASLTIDLSALSSRVQDGDGSQWAEGSGLPASKVWFANNFRLDIDGVDCRYVKTVGPLEVGVIPAGVSGLVVTLDESRASDFMAWQEQVGYRGALAGKTGKLEFLAPNGHTVYLTLNLSGLVPTSLTLGGQPAAPSILQTKSPAGGTVKKYPTPPGHSPCEVKMSCESARLS